MTVEHEERNSLLGRFRASRKRYNLPAKSDDVPLVEQFDDIMRARFEETNRVYVSARNVVDSNFRAASLDVFKPRQGDTTVEQALVWFREAAIDFKSKMDTSQKAQADSLASREEECRNLTRIEKIIDSRKQLLPSQVDDADDLPSRLNTLLRATDRRHQETSTLVSEGESFMKQAFVAAGIAQMPKPESPTADWIRSEAERFRVELTQILQDHQTTSETWESAFEVLMKKFKDMKKDAETELKAWGKMYAELAELYDRVADNYDEVRKECNKSKERYDELAKIYDRVVGIPSSE